VTSLSYAFFCQCKCCKLLVTLCTWLCLQHLTVTGQPSYRINFRKFWNDAKHHTASLWQLIFLFKFYSSVLFIHLYSMFSLCFSCSDEQLNCFLAVFFVLFTKRATLSCENSDKCFFSKRKFINLKTRANTCSSLWYIQGY